MNKEQILHAIKGLAMSQGFYGSLLQTIQEDESYLDYLEQQNFGDVVDMVIWLES